MKNILDFLKQLGFSDIEIKLYLTLLKSGEMSVAGLAEAAKINRTAAYGYINSLLEKGIIAKVQGTSNKIAANPPEDLHHLVEQKLQTAKMLQENLSPIISTLNASFPQAIANTTSDIKYYKGRNGAKAIYEECLKAKELRSYVNIIEIVDIFPENIDLFNNAFDSNPTMKMYEFVEDSPESRARIDTASQRKNYLFKFLPNDVKISSTDTLIYDDKVSIINLRDKNNLNGVVVRNKDYYNNSKQLFDLLWRFIPELPKK